MTGGLNDLAAALGFEPFAPATPPTPSFSTIVRTQGHRPTSLTHALGCLRDQTHTDHETVLAVHNPDPATADQVEAAIPDRIRPPGLRIIAVTDGGRSRPLNEALAVATGDYVCFLDDDDLVTPDWLSAFARAATDAPGTMVRSVTLSQAWATDGTGEPVRATGPVEQRYPPVFDLLAHLSRNETPLCSVALPRPALERFGIQFAEELPVYEDWDVIMRVAMWCGVTSIPDETAVYRHLDDGNAASVVDEAVWHEAHTAVLDRLSDLPLLLPTGDARRVASGHFAPGEGSTLQAQVDAARADYLAVTRSPLRFARAFGGRIQGALANRLGARRRG